MRFHLKLDKAAARSRALELLESVGIPEPERRLKAYPHQLSGGQRQRVVIAAALSCNPRLLVADEPTTALDVSVQAQILKLLRDLADSRGIGILLVTHNMGVVAQIADRVTIMHRGKVVETGTTEEVLRRPKAAYAKALIGAVPRIDQRLDRFPVLGDEGKGRAEDARAELRAKAERSDAVADEAPILSVENLCVDYTTSGWLPGSKGHRFRAVDDVSFSVRGGEVFGLVGESGCGKTTIANVVSGLVRPTAGRVLYRGQSIAGEGATRRVGPLRQAIQMIFQDPYSSLNSRMRIGSILSEPILFYRLAGSRAEAESDVARLIEAVGLEADAAQRFPHAFSGGQRQRLSIARALGRASEADRLRRADIIPRRFGAGPDPEPAEGPARCDRPDPAAHQPRSRRGAPDVRPRRGDAAGTAPGAGRFRNPLRHAAASLYTGAAVARSNP